MNPIGEALLLSFLLLVLIFAVGVLLVGLGMMIYHNPEICFFFLGFAVLWLIVAWTIWKFDWL